MIASEVLAGAECYQVEVSGWDENEMFFVEKSDLAWDEFVGKHVSLEHMLPDGAIIFVRLLLPTALRQDSPVAYQVEFIGCDPKGAHQFRLNGVQPRYSPEFPQSN